ncbi:MULTISPECIES: diguanylate cyclase domain-containing protein [Gammaproteobacteria]|uniref:diguanylate cyclase domain-containing protein n=1 Tax=Gammaproteobacteria TaxID=1236 RepID=UPI000DD0D069|nr:MULTISPECIES: diguanylate cyclase [Gammaproteobacteria]RTE87082.1 diguanylate cyclase [Aliidiomarina sp. B3213]TCZ93129.1 diguanylate cyclase [Lysobacter sp. N42]
MASSLSLKTRFTLLIIAVVLGAIVLLGALVYNLTSTYITESIGRSISERAVNMVERLDQNMSARVQEVELLTSLYEANDSLNSNQLREQLEQIQQQHTVSSWIGLLDSNGRVQVATGSILEGANISHRPVFEYGSQSLWVGDVHEALLLSDLLPNPSGEPIKFVDVAAPLRNSDGTLRGVLAMHLSWEWAEHVMQSMFQTTSSDAFPIEYFVVAANNTVLMGPENTIGADLQSLTTDTLPAGLEGASWRIQTWQDGSFLTGFAKTEGAGNYPGLGWKVVARVPTVNAFEPLHILQNRIAIFGLGLTVLFAGIGWFFTARFSAPLLRLSAAADKIKSLQDEITIPEEHASPELMGLSQSLNSLIGRLKSQREEIDDLEDIVHTDPLTGLHNRTFLNEYLGHALAESKRNQGCLALMYIDLDEFKDVNDNMGHHAGDVLLQKLAKRLKHIVREEDIIARVGGDEFVMAIKANAEEVETLLARIADRVIKKLSKSVNVGEGQEAHVGVSVGAAWWPSHGSSIDEVARRADKALYQAKESGKGQYIMYTNDNE